MQQTNLVTGAEAGLSGDDQIRIALREILLRGGSASIEQIYHAVEQHMGGARLSPQGKASLRFFVNRAAVQTGYIYPFEKENPGWRITPTGREYLEVEGHSSNEVTNATEEANETPSNSAKGTAFENLYSA